MLSEYKTVSDISSGEYVVKGSRFIACLTPVQTPIEAQTAVENARKKYYDARHHCWAYILKDGFIRYSDDGEPQGTAGQPILNILKHSGFTDAICVVTRYFGGTLLGTGGLARAYSETARIAVEAAVPQIISRFALVKFKCDYRFYNLLQSKLSNWGGIIRTSDFSEDVKLVIAVKQAGAEKLISNLTQHSGGTVMPEIVEYIYLPEQS